MTKKRQYAFYKANTWFNETILLYKGHDVLSKPELMASHWKIFGKTFDAKCKKIPC